MPKGRHFGRQNGAKIDPKTKPKFKSEKDGSWRRFVSIWARLGGGLEEKNVCFSLRFKAFRENRRFGIWERFGMDLDLQNDHFGSPKPPKREAKTSQKRDQNDIKILIDFWLDF